VGAFDPEVEVQAGLRGSPLVSGRGETFGGATGVGAYAMLLTFADLHPGGGQLDQALEQVGGGSSTALRMPEPFPDFVRFPIITGVE
jgi:hypothetical protein